MKGGTCTPRARNAVFPRRPRQGCSSAYSTPAAGSSSRTRSMNGLSSRAALPRMQAP